MDADTSYHRRLDEHDFTVPAFQKKHQQTTAPNEDH